MRVNRSWQFEGKSDLAISGGVNRTDDLRANRTWQFEGKSDLAILGGVNCTDDLRVNRTWRFEGKSDLAILGGAGRGGRWGKSYRQFEGKLDMVLWGRG